MLGRFIKWLLSLITDDKTGKPSHSKIWSNIGAAALTRIMLKLPPEQISMEIILAYGGLVMGNNLLIYWMKRHYNQKEDGGNGMDQSNGGPADKSCE